MVPRFGSHKNFGRAFVRAGGAKRETGRVDGRSSVRARGSNQGCHGILPLRLKESGLTRRFLRPPSFSLVSLFFCLANRAVERRRERGNIAASHSDETAGAGAEGWRERAAQMVATERATEAKAAAQCVKKPTYLEEK